MRFKLAVEEDVACPGTEPTGIPGLHIAASQDERHVAVGMPVSRKIAGVAALEAKGSDAEGQIVHFERLDQPEPEDQWHPFIG